MAFIVVAPLVSRVLPAQMSMQDMMGSDCPHALADMGHPATPDGAPNATDHCGYCVLLDHQSLLAGKVVLYLLPAPPPFFVSVALPQTDIPATPRPDARPRAPPYYA